MFNLFKKKKATRITAINLKLQGYTHVLAGLDSSAEQIELKIPFKNKLHTDMLVNSGYFKAEKSKPITIEKIEVSEPFIPTSIEPKVPIEIEADALVEFKINVTAPPHNYSGPLNLHFVSKSPELIHLEISKTVLVYKGKKVEIESSSRMLNIEKGKIFIEKIQLLKSMSYGDNLSKVSASFPFKLIGTDPILPLQLDGSKPTILSLQIQSPQQTYSGVMEILLE